MMGHNYVTNLHKMPVDTPKLDRISINEYIKFDEILSICSQKWTGNKILTPMKGHTGKSGKNLRKKTGNNSKIALVNMKSCIKCGVNMLIGSQDIERKRNSD